MQYLHLAQSLALAASIATVAWLARTLTRSGAVAACVVGTLVFQAGRMSGAIPLLVFFATSNLLGRWRKMRKEMLGFDKGGRRDWAQVAANSAAAAVLIGVSGALMAAHQAKLAMRLYVGFAAAIAEANADTWATEIGAASASRPRLITTFAVAGPGRSGAVSLSGLVASLAGSALVGICCLPFLHNIHFGVVVVIAGFAGALADSLFGATLQGIYLTSSGVLSERRESGNRLIAGFAWINNDIVNFLGTLVAAVLAIALTSP